MRHVGVAMLVLAAACGPVARPAPERPLAAAAAATRLELEHAGAPADAPAAPLLGILRAELERNLRELQARGEPAPYFVGLGVGDLRSTSIDASFGALTKVEEEQRRILDVAVRVGDHRLDNTHPMPEGEDFDSYMRRFGRGRRLPFEDDAGAIRNAVWLAIDEQYRDAVEQLVKVRANRAIKTEDEDKSDDFSREQPARLLEATAELRLDVASWTTRIKSFSELFGRHAEVHESEVMLRAVAENRYFVSSENANTQTARTHLRLAFWASTTADDGMELFRYESIDAPTERDLPEDAEIRERMQGVIDDLLALRRAPVAEPYEGPAIVEGKAAGVLLHEVFGHRVEGHRQKQDDEGQTFAKKLGTQVMPSFIDVYDDPTLTRINGVFLNGHYRVDDEGVAAERAHLVKAGVLKTFLMSRSPTRGITRSNGHGRRQTGRPAVARQANLVLDPARTVTPAELKRRLIVEVKRRNKPYGLRFTEVAGGFTVTGRWLPQAFKVLPVMVYRVYPDGREELVRGVDLEGTPLTTLTKILAAANDFAVFNGVCGAESGWVPVSSTSPSLLVEQIEIARQAKERDRPPILGPPPKGGAR